MTDTVGQLIDMIVNQQNHQELSLKKITDSIISYNQAIDVYKRALAELDVEGANWVYEAAVKCRMMLLLCEICGIPPTKRIV